MLSEYRFLDVLKILLTFGKTFELKNGFPFMNATNENVVADLKGSKTLPGARLAISGQNIWIAITMLRCPEVLEVFYYEAPKVLELPI